MTNQTAVEIFGVDANGEYKTVYGYVSEGEYLKHKDKAYEVSGGNWPFMVDVEIQGDVVKVVKEYGDGVSSESQYSLGMGVAETKVFLSNLSALSSRCLAACFRNI